MTVRWKPLLILSGLFVVVALVGVFAIVMTLAPRSSQGTLKLARAAQEAGRFEDAEIHYKQALQIESKSAAIYEEFAGLYREWSQHAPAEKQAALHGEWLGNLANAVKFSKTLKRPRQQLLQDAMAQDLAPDSVYWAKELLNIEPEDADAHYALAAEALEERTPNVPEIKQHLEVLDKIKASPVRRLWIRAKLADLTGDDVGARWGLRRGSRDEVRLGFGSRGSICSAPAHGDGDPGRVPMGAALRPGCPAPETGQRPGQARGNASDTGGPSPDPARANPEGAARRGR